MRLKGKFYRSALRPTMFYGSETDSPILFNVALEKVIRELKRTEGGAC